MNKPGMNAGLAAIVLVSTTAMAADQHVMVQPDTLKWSSAPPVLPKGAQIALLYGDPDKAEPFVFRLKFPAGYKVAVHIPKRLHSRASLRSPTRSASNVSQRA